MKSLKSLFVAIAVFCLLGVSAVAQESGLFGLVTLVEAAREDRGLGEDIVQTRLYRIDPETAALTEIGPTGFTECSGLDFEPVTNELFAVCRRLELIDPDPKLKLDPEEEVGDVLVKVDRITGEAVEIGQLNEMEDRNRRVSDISFRSDGVLFAHVNDVGFGMAALTTEAVPDNNNSLGIINTQTGRLTILGPTGFEDTFSAIGFSLRDNLYHGADDGTMGALNMLDQTTGNATLMNALAYPDQFDGRNIIGSMDTQPVTNVLFAVLFSQNIDPDPRSSGSEAVDTRAHAPDGFFLLNIDPASGNIDLIGQLSGLENQLTAIAFLDDRRIEVPTLSEYGLIVTVVMLLGAAVVFLRRRQIKSGI